MAVVKSATLSGAATFFLYQATSGGIDSIDVRNNGALPTQTDEQYVSLVLDSTDPRLVVDNQQASTHQLVLNLSNSRVNSVRALPFHHRVLGYYV